MVGDVAASRRPLEAPGPLDNAPFEAAINLGRSIGRLGQGLQDLVDVETERQRKLAESQALVGYHETTNRLLREQEEAQQNAAPGGKGFVRERRLTNATEMKKWLATLSPELQTEFAPRVALFEEQQTNAAYAFELDQSAKYAEQGLQLVTDNATKALIAGTASLQEARDTVLESAAAMPVAPASREAYAVAAQRSIEAAAAERLAKDSFSNPETNLGSYPGALADGSTMVLQGVPAPIVGLANATASRESGGKYNIITGGQTFSDYSQHPNVRVLLFNKDGTPKLKVDGETQMFSTAAGRYQITKETWDWLKSEGVYLPDFSPESQDRAFVALARRRYSLYTGGASLDAALASGDPATVAGVRDILSPTWIGLKGMKNEAFISAVMTANETPLAFLQDPQFAHLSGPEMQDILETARRENGRQLARDEAVRQAALDVQEEELLTAIRTGDATPMTMRQARSTWLRDPARIARVTKEFNDVNESLIAAQEFEARISSNPASIHMGEKKDRDAADNWAEKSGIIAGLQNKDMQAVSQLISTSKKIAGVPRSAVQQLVTMSRSPATFEFGMDALALLMEQAPGEFDLSVDKATFANTLFYAANKGNMTQEMMLEAMKIRQTPAYSQVVEGYNKITEDYLKDNPITMKQIVDGVFPQPRGVGLAITDAEPPIVAGRRIALQADYESTFRGQMLLYGNVEQAMEATNRLIQREWGASDAAGTRRIMKHPPERYAPLLENGHEWMAPQLRKDLNLTEEDNVVLYANEKTEADIARGEPPRYNVMVVDVNGVPRAVTRGELGLPGNPTKLVEYTFTVPAPAQELEAQRVSQERLLSQMEYQMEELPRMSPGERQQTLAEAERLLQDAGDTVDLQTPQGERLRRLRETLKNPPERGLIQTDTDFFRQSTRRRGR